MYFEIHVTKHTEKALYWFYIEFHSERHVSCLHNKKVFTIKLFRYIHYMYLTNLCTNIHGTPINKGSLCLRRNTKQFT